MEGATAAMAGRPTDTVYAAVVDRDGAACSFIQSVFDNFGSKLVVPESGIVLHNRGAGFVLDDTHPNRPVPGKRPYHTIIPAMLGGGNGFLGCLGVVGTLMQPQGQLQVLQNVLDLGMDPQTAIDAPRWRWISGQVVGFERGFDGRAVRSLAARGHEVSELETREAGGAQMILRSGDRLLGGSDPRKDGRVLVG
jgi:gamma-glutamyltranspeptidase/glutathione hydrolase